MYTSIDYTSKTLQPDGYSCQAYSVSISAAVTEQFCWLCMVAMLLKLPSSRNCSSLSCRVACPGTVQAASCSNAGTSEHGETAGEKDWKEQEILFSEKKCCVIRSTSNTVKPALSDHPTVQEKVVVIDRWSLKQGSLNSGRFSMLCWTVANVVVRMRTINATISHVDLVEAVASCGGSLANLRCGCCF